MADAVADPPGERTADAGGRERDGGEDAGVRVAEPEPLERADDEERLGAHEERRARDDPGEARDGSRLPQRAREFGQERRAGPRVLGARRLDEEEDGDVAAGEKDPADEEREAEVLREVAPRERRRRPEAARDAGDLADEHLQALCGAEAVAEDAREELVGGRHRDAREEREDRLGRIDDRDDGGRRRRVGAEDCPEHDPPDDLRGPEERHDEPPAPQAMREPEGDHERRDAEEHREADGADEPLGAGEPAEKRDEDRRRGARVAEAPEELPEEHGGEVPCEPRRSHERIARQRTPRVT